MAEKHTADQLTENLFDAVKTISKKIISTVNFDKTIDAIVVDATNSANGVYQVSADGATFTAYSTSTDYKINDSVMVTIPQGDYDNQKIIIGKKATKEADSIMVYKSPFASIADLTNNLILGNIIDRTSELYANYEDRSSIVVYTNPTELSLTGYTRLGFVGEFSTWLQEYNTIAGTYGVKIILSIRNADKNEVYTKELIFDSDSFFGNVYGFASYSTQEVVFDIADYVNDVITGFQLIFFQSNDFYDTNGEKIPAPLDIDNPFNLIQPNIYLKDPYLCLGVDADTFDQDSCLLVTDNSKVYHKQLRDNETQLERAVLNEKYIFLRWIHKDNISGLIHTIEQGNVPTEYSIYWYRHSLQSTSTDKFMGAHWERLKVQGENGETYSNLTEGYASFDSTRDAELFAANQGLKIIFDPCVNNPDERLVAVIVNNNIKVAQSPELIFTNNDEVRNTATYIDDNALAIKTTDNTTGQYAGYNRANNLIQASEATVVRTLQAVFDDTEKPADLYSRANLSNCNEIIWYLPARRSMITPVNEDGSSITGTTTTDGNYYVLHYTRTEADPDNTSYYKVHYCIKKSFSNAYNNNIVKLEVQKDGLWYAAQIELKFQGAGTSGSDYTILLDHPGVNSYFTTEDGNTFTPIQCTLFLQGSDFNIVKLPPGAVFTLKWITSNSGNTDNASPTTPEIADNIATFTLYPRAGATMNTLHILQVTLSGFDDIGNLVAHFPIPSRQNYNGNTIGSSNINKITLTGVDAPEEVRYASSGEADYYKNPCSVNATITSNNTTELRYHNGSEFIIPGSSVAQNSGIIEYWALISGANNNTMFGPSLQEAVQHKINNVNDGGGNNKYNAPILNPPGIYFKESIYYGLQFFIKNNNTLLAAWTQPIFVYQDNYPSTTLNKWNGKDIQLNQDEGTVVANGFAAGKKDNGKFTGVILGDWSRSDIDPALTKRTGVYGMHQGAMAYAIKDDGTMFLGKDGHGRIEFNGNTGTIKSSTWDSYNWGTNFDLDDGILNIKGQNQNQTLIQPGELYIKVPYTVNNNTTLVPLMQVTSNQYYLQSYEYGSGNGTKIDLSNGTFDVKHTNQNQTTIKPGELYIKAAQTVNNTTTQKTLMQVTSNQYYLQSYDFDDTSGSEAGVKFDLKNGKLTGYKFDLLAGTGYNQIKLTSDDSQTNNSYNKKPLEIGQQFNVSWEGDVTANGGNIAGWYFKKPTSNVYGSFASSDYYGLFATGSDTNIDNNYTYETAMRAAKIQLHPNFGLRLWKDNYQDNNGNDAFDNAIVIDPSKDDSDSYVVIGEADHKSWPLSIAKRVTISGTNYYPTPFAVSWDGELYSAAGTIGGWTIDPTAIKNGAIILDSENNMIKAGNIGTEQNPIYPFTVDANGNLTAKRGTIGGWTLTENTIQNDNDNPSIVLDKQNGIIRAGSLNNNTYAFQVTTGGALTAKSGTIGGWYITANTLQNAESSPTIKFDSTAGSDSTLKIGNTFKVSSSGELTASAGTIGGWQIDTNSLSNGGITLSTSGHNDNESAYIDAPAYYIGNNKFINGVLTPLTNATFETITIPQAATSYTTNISADWTNSTYTSVSVTDTATYSFKDGEGNDVTIVVPTQFRAYFPDLSATTTATRPAAVTHSVATSFTGRTLSVMRLGQSSEWTISGSANNAPNWTDYINP